MEKFPDRQKELEEFMSEVLGAIRTVSTPEENTPAEAIIRDPKDRPILRAALKEHADVFLTGDKDFLESSLKDPRIISVTEFLNMQ